MDPTSLLVWLWTDDVMIADYHLHTHASTDATGNMADYINAAKRRKILEIGFSEHALLCPLSRRPDSFASKMPSYTQDFLDVKENSDLTVRLGIEIDFFPMNFSRQRSLFKCTLLTT
jgi:histidinol phosphatase-like PHP family hydrolase